MLKGQEDVFDRLINTMGNVKEINKDIKTEIGMQDKILDKVNKGIESNVDGVRK